MTEKKKNDTTGPGQAKRGPKSKKTPERIEKLLELTAKGKTDVEIAEIIGVTEATIRNWKKMDFELLMAVRELKQEVDEVVESSLLKRALGYEVYEEKLNKDGDLRELRKHIPADTQAIKFWLMNRQRDKWAEKVNHELEGKDGAPITLIVEDYRKKDEDGKKDS